MALDRNPGCLQLLRGPFMRESTAVTPVVSRRLLVSLWCKRRRMQRWLQQLYAVNASRNLLLRVFVAGLLISCQLTVALMPGYAQALQPSLSGTIVGQGLHSSGAVYVDLRLTNTGTGAA